MIREPGYPGKKSSRRLAISRGKCRLKWHLSYGDRAAALVRRTISVLRSEIKNNNDFGTMPAYYRESVISFLSAHASQILGTLQHRYADDGFLSQYTRQTKVWAHTIPLLQSELAEVFRQRPAAAEWTVLLEYPLYRLRRRIDVVILAGPALVVIEAKSGGQGFPAENQRQVEEYALDLRDFHAESKSRKIHPVLWNTHASEPPVQYPLPLNASDPVSPVHLAGKHGLRSFLARVNIDTATSVIASEDWDHSAYQPVPTIVEAATAIFSQHNVRNIANADAENLRVAASRLVDLIQEARTTKCRFLLMLTGVPGSGKTLAGLEVVHNAVASGVEERGDIVYLSGNTPLVTVLREALARDQHAREKGEPDGRSLEDVRRDVRARIQHINDFLKDGLSRTRGGTVHEHAIVFDEAQRAWDEKQGREKFDREASEPALLLELMARQPDWCACVCLVGGGQEINSGEEGVRGWGEALRKMPVNERKQWTVIAPPDVFAGGETAGGFSIGELPADVQHRVDPELQLRVPQRSFRSPDVSQWVNAVLAGRTQEAEAIASSLGNYPVLLTRSIEQAKSWLKAHGRGERRYGLLASSGARRLRAYGYGIMLHATAGAEIAHWYLNPKDDIRSSFALEVPANEYSCQGLELDLTCLCWGGDMLWDQATQQWVYSRLSGNVWQQVRSPVDQTYITNSYRVLLTRAREGMILWVPEGSPTDSTRLPEPLDATADFLLRCGAKHLA